MKIRFNLMLIIFIIIFILTKQIEIYGIIMFFSLLHELGHMLAGIILGFKPRIIEINPFGLSVSFESKVENFNKKIKKASILTIKKMIIAICGPNTNLLCILAILAFKDIIPQNIEELIIYSNILIGLFNLVPIYPLDGGRILKYALEIMYGKYKAYKYINSISNITISLLTAISSVLILYYKNIAILFILLYLWLIVIKENKKYNNKKMLYERLITYKCHKNKLYRI